jgi:hypothetical protein
MSVLACRRGESERDYVPPRRVHAPTPACREQQVTSVLRTVLESALLPSRELSFTFVARV